MDKINGNLMDHWSVNNYRITVVCKRSLKQLFDQSSAWLGINIVCYFAQLIPAFIDIDELNLYSNSSRRCLSDLLACVFLLRRMNCTQSMHSMLSKTLDLYYKVQTLCRWSPCMSVGAHDFEYRLRMFEYKLTRRTREEKLLQRIWLHKKTFFIM